MEINNKSTLTSIKQEVCASDNAEVTELAALEKEIHDVELQLELLEQRCFKLRKRRAELVKRQNDRQDAAAYCLANGFNHYDRSEGFEWSERVRELSNALFKIETFRPLQLAAINCTLSGRDCLLVMPTGAGKSLCFQLPALIQPQKATTTSFTLVVSPLVALMEDQVIGLRARGINAAMLNASASLADVKAVTASMIGNANSEDNVFHLVYVTPEKLAKSKTFMNKLESSYRAGRLARIAIDEVHCCSQWGHDFRPDYKFLGVLRRQFPTVPIIGLTATATDRVIQDVRKMLHLAPDTLLLRAPFDRANLFYRVVAKPRVKADALSHLTRLLKSERYCNESGIVYVFSQRDAEDVAGHLQNNGVRSAFFHAEIAPAVRSSTHQNWLSGKIRVIVATIAFGMGIDKPNVRFVVHYSVSKSLENYYQESGRAGRDGQRADCVLYFRLGDVFRVSSMVFTEQTGLANLYQLIEYAVKAGFCRRQLLAQYFGEQRTMKLTCGAMCDHCQMLADEKRRALFQLRDVDITALYKFILKLLEQQALKGKNARITCNKLFDLLVQPSRASLLNSWLPDTDMLRQDQLEFCLVHLLLQNYLKEDFHFTPYSTVSYVAVGDRAPTLSTPILMSMYVSCTRSAAEVQSSSSVVGRRREVSVLNRDEAKSRLALPLLTSAASLTLAPQLSTASEVEDLTTSSRREVGPRKRLCVSDSEESDEGDFDFGSGVASQRNCKRQHNLPAAHCTEKIVHLDLCSSDAESNVTIF